MNRIARRRPMHPDEEATIRAFVTRARRPRWLELLASGRRGAFLDRLNHCPDFDERFATMLPSKADAVAALRSRGAPATCRVISDIAAIDGREMPLADAVWQAEVEVWGTLICCIPGRLAYYSDEAGTERRLLLERPDA